MNIELPDGTMLEGVPEGTTKEQLRSKLAAGGYDVSKLDPAPAPAAVTTAAAAPATGGVMDRLWEGTKIGAKKLRDEMLPPGNPINALSMGTVGTDDTLERQANVKADAERLPSLGTAGAIGSHLPEAAASLIPVARAGALVSKAPLLARTLGRAAPLVADVAVNAGYEGGKAALTGEDVGDAAGKGGMAAGAGHVVGGVLQKGVGPIMSAGARTLAEHGITPTVGQMFGRAGSAVEGMAAYLPVVGTAISRARSVALKQYSRAEVNKAISPLGTETKKFGEDAVLEARKVINDSYNNVVDRTHMPALDAQNAILSTQQSMGTMPLLSQPQIDAVEKYINLKIQPELSFSQQTGNIVPGRTMKNIDAELGATARKYLDSADPAHHPLGEAFRDLQLNLRNALQSNDKDALDALRKSNTAFRNMLPVEKASIRAGGNIGEMTPKQMFDAAQGMGQDQRGGGLNRAARELLGQGGPNDFRIATQAGGGLAAGIGGDPLLTGLAIAGSHAAYSLPMRKLLAGGTEGVAPRFLRRAAGKLPFTQAQLAARIAANEANEGD